MALASAKLFVEEGAYVFITGRKQEQIDEAIKVIGRNVTGVQGDAANLEDLVEAADDQAKLGRMTDWQAPEGAPVRGHGARLFLVGDDAIGLLDWRELKLEPPGERGA